MVVAGGRSEQSDELSDDLRDPTVTLKSWRQFVGGGIAELELRPLDEWLALDPVVKEADDEQRVTFHSELVQVSTSTVRSVSKQGRLLIMLNRREISARRNLIVSGPWATGKTTALKLLGRTHELRVCDRYPGSDRIPVVYVSTPPNGSPRKLAMEMARFLGLPEPRRGQNATDVAETVCAILRRGRCELVLVDEIHRLDMQTTQGENMSDHIKQIAEHTAATFVYAGIDVENSTVFTGVRGQQFAARSVILHTEKFPLGAEWTAVVAQMEQALRLYRHVQGTLTGLTRYLHDRTNGSIASLSHLIRLGAQMAIVEGTERLDREVLDPILLSGAAGAGS